MKTKKKIINQTADYISSFVMMVGGFSMILGFFTHNDVLLQIGTLTAMLGAFIFFILIVLVKEEARDE